MLSTILAIVSYSSVQLRDFNSSLLVAVIHNSNVPRSTHDDRTLAVNISRCQLGHSANLSIEVSSRGNPSSLFNYQRHRDSDKSHMSVERTVHENLRSWTYPSYSIRSLPCGLFLSAGYM